MREPETSYDHIGFYIRHHVIPPGVSVTGAAQLLGVGRPALSNLLNGQAALSRQMALRLERAFGVDHEELLAGQSSLQSKNLDQLGQAATVGRYTPNVAVVRAAQIERWSEDSPSRQKLPVLMRKLVHAVGEGLESVDFPGYDNAERPGWDGFVEAAVATPWIPQGKSGWELSTREDIKRKADEDYAARMASVPAEERADCTFVFVTSRNWPGKDQWVKEKTALGHWREVRAYDASDLEQWAEHSATAQIWLAETLSIGVEGYRSLERCWQDWAAVTAPRLSTKLFDPAVAAHAAQIDSWLKGTSSAPLTIAADSVDEALAFLACAGWSPSLRHHDLASRAVVFDTPEGPRRFGGVKTAPLIAVATSREVEREMGSLHESVPCIIVRFRNPVDPIPTITLDRLNRASFEAALHDMSIDHERAEMLYRESGRSPTVLRRRLARLDSIREPAWVRDEAIASNLIPMVLAGAWNQTSDADVEVIGLLSGGVDAGEPDSRFRQLSRLEDGPVWEVGQHRGVVSKLDAMFATGGFITPEHLDAFFFVAEYVLSEADPALELPEDSRWMAPVLGKSRVHSAALRSGICETLVILAVHGDAILRGRNLRLQQRIDGLVRKLAENLSVEKLLSLRHDLPDFAEASPEVFLRLLEQDLRRDEPLVLDLLAPAGSRWPTSPKRTELLWALERLAWNPAHFPRVVAILARMATVKIDDNWANSPRSTLLSIVRDFYPQTGANSRERVRALEKIAADFPEVGWLLCIAQLGSGFRIALGNSRPRWRPDAVDAAAVVANSEPSGELSQRAFELVLAWPQHNPVTLGYLVERMRWLPEPDRERVRDLIRRWASSASDEGKVALLRRLELSMRYGPAGTALFGDLAECLTSCDLIARHEGLLSSHWLGPYDDGTSDDFDPKARMERLRHRQLAALQEIWTVRGEEGLGTLIGKNTQSAAVVGVLASDLLPEPEEFESFVRYCVVAAFGDAGPNFLACLRMMLAGRDETEVAVLVKAAETELAEDQLVTLLMGLPLRASTWPLLEGMPAPIRQAYWNSVRVSGFVFEPEVMIEVVDRLLQAGRAVSAFEVAQFQWARLETRQLIRLLHEVARADWDAFEDKSLLHEAVSDVFSALDQRADATIEEKVQLEIMYFGMLEWSLQGIPNIELTAINSAEFFADLVMLAYGKAANVGEQGADTREAQRSIARRVLGRLRRIPGANEQGSIAAGLLSAWVEDVRSLCSANELLDECDLEIGQLLSMAPGDGDGFWPSSAVCEVLEKIGTDAGADGLQQGLFNQQGVYSLENGGAEQIERAQRYRVNADRIVYDFPYVAGLLRAFAELCEERAEDIRSQMELIRRLGD